MKISCVSIIFSCVTFVCLIFGSLYFINANTSNNSCVYDAENSGISCKDGKNMTAYNYVCQNIGNNVYSNRIHGQDENIADIGSDNIQKSIESSDLKHNTSYFEIYQSKKLDNYGVTKLLNKLIKISKNLKETYNNLPDSELSRMMLAEIWQNKDILKHLKTGVDCDFNFFNDLLCSYNQENVNSQPILIVKESNKNITNVLPKVSCEKYESLILKSADTKPNMELVYKNIGDLYTSGFDIILGILKDISSKEENSTDFENYTKFSQLLNVTEAINTDDITTELQTESYTKDVKTDVHMTQTESIIDNYDTTTSLNGEKDYNIETTETTTDSTSVDVNEIDEKTTKEALDDIQIGTNTDKTLSNDKSIETTSSIIEIAGNSDDQLTGSTDAESRTYMPDKVTTSEEMNKASESITPESITPESMTDVTDVLDTENTTADIRLGVTIADISGKSQNVTNNVSDTTEKQVTTEEIGQGEPVTDEELEKVTEESAKNGQDTPNSTTEETA